MHQRHRHLRRPFIASMGLAALLLTACGPSTPVEVGVQDYPTDVLLGLAKAAPPPAPKPQAEIAPDFPPFILPALPSFAPEPVPALPSFTPPPAPISCPTADPFAVPAETKTSVVKAPPKEGLYTYRQKGTYADGSKSATVPAQVTREVTKISLVTPGDNSDFTYQVIVTEFDKKTTTTYEVRNVATDPTGATNGIFINDITTETAGNGTPQQFTPVPHVSILPFPVQSGENIAGAGTDAIHNIHMDVNGKVGPDVRVDACGTIIDAWSVSITGRIVSPTNTRLLTATYAIATQLGGLSVMDDITLTPATPADQQIKEHVISTVNSMTPDPLPPSPSPTPTPSGSTRPLP